MSSFDEKVTITLIAVSLTNLAVGYELIGLDEIVLKIPLGAVGEIKPKSIELIQAILFALNCGLLIGHVRLNWNKIKHSFSGGYRENALLLDYLSEYIAEIVGDKRYGSLQANIRPSFKRNTYNFGKLSKRNGQLSADVIIKIPTSLHWRCLFSGMFSYSYKHILMSVFAPLVLGILGGVAIFI